MQPLFLRERNEERMFSEFSIFPQRTEDGLMECLNPYRYALFFFFSFFRVKYLTGKQRRPPLQMMQQNNRTREQDFSSYFDCIRLPFIRVPDFE
ncbi:hypothetical protein OUZ56_027725 [Daphnia magna]|uniref:Uncharacterized protein n=1 Tax=Daphnia magna TaxID=35525 RepID=A0ABR0B1R3_9CRUS|nr:hypothetical protein OUZ56_027725 [Daphnia magna]